MNATNVLQRDPRALDYVTDLIDEFGPELFGFDAETETLHLDVGEVRDAEGNGNGLSKMLAEEPDKAAYNIKQAFDEHPETPTESVEVESLQNAPRTTVGGIRAEDYQKLRTLTVDITESSNQYGQPVSKHYQCHYCGTTVEIEQDPINDDDLEPHRCPNDDCGKSSFGVSKLDCDDCQSAIVQDLPEASLNPKDMEVRFFTDDVNEYVAGDRVTLTVIVRTVSENNTSRVYPRLEVVHAETEEEKAVVELDDEDIAEFEELAENEDILELLLESYAPHLKGDEIAPSREGVLLSLYSGEFGTDIRDTIHGLHIAEPSTGKSNLLEIAREVAPHSAFVSGSSRITEAGLTAGMERQGKLDTEEWKVKAGAMLRANDGVALIDEMDKFPTKLQQALYDPLSSQSIKVDMIGEDKEFECNPATLVAANPENERFNMANPIGDQLPFPHALLSRFDLIFTARDTTDADRAKARATTKKHKDLLEVDGEQPIPYDQMRKLIHYSRTEYQPELTDEATDFIEDKWVSLRESETGAGGISIDTRQQNSLYRVARTYARIRLSDTVELEDAKRAWDITRTTFARLNRFGDSDTFDVTMLYSGESTSQSERKEDILNKIRELNSSENTHADEGLVADALSEDYEKDEVRAELELLKESGKIFPQSGVLKCSKQT